ncbi:MAG: hypothetical protein WBH90_15305, partial [Aggregatilineales bacterium]
MAATSNPTQRPRPARVFCLLALAVVAALLLPGCTGLPEAEVVRTSYIGPPPEGGDARLGKGALNALAFSPDASTLAAGGEVGLYLYDVASLDTLWSLPTPAPVLSAAFSPDGALLAAGLENGTALLVNPASGQTTITLDLTDEQSGGVDALAWSPTADDGSVRLALGYDNRQVIVVGFEQAGGYEVIGELPQLGAVPSVMSYSPNGAILATGDHSGLITLWEARTAQSLGTLEGHSATVASLDWAPDGTTLLSGARDGRVIVWDTIQAQARHVLEAGASPILAVTYTADGTTFGSISEAGTIATWDASSASPSQTFEGIAGEPGVAAWSPDATRLAEVTQDGQLAVWDLEQAQIGSAPVERLAGHAPQGQRALTVA